MNNGRELDIIVGVCGVLLLICLSIAIMNIDDSPKPSIDININCPDGKCPWLVEDLADIPPELRQPNYSPHGSGSCVHAATITLLRWQGLDEMADWWYDQYHSGEYADRLIERLEYAGLRYAVAEAGDTEFLEWATRNRFSAGIFYKPYHAVNLVDLTDKYAILLDNNNIGEYEYVPRETFLRKWKNQYGGFAWTIVYSPPPKTPSW